MPNGVIPVIALEVEWYLRAESAVEDASQYIENFLKWFTASAAHLPLHSASGERGYLQAEAALLPTKNINQLITDYYTLRDVAENSARKIGAQADFSAKPFAEDYGSGIHVHVHLEDKTGQHLFFKDGESLSDALRFSIGGLLSTLEENLPIFIPTSSSWQRIVPGFHAPVNVSWGFNNRTTAIRLPDSISEYQGARAIAAAPATRFKRIEHRVAGSDANIENVIDAVLKGIDKGLIERIEPPEPIFGNAQDMQYALKNLREKA